MSNPDKPKIVDQKSQKSDLQNDQQQHDQKAPESKLSEDKTKHGHVDNPSSKTGFYSKDYWNMSRAMTSELFGHHRYNVFQYHETGKKIVACFEKAKVTPNPALRRLITGDIGEHGMEQLYYSRQSDKPIINQPTKIGRTGMDGAFTEGRTLAEITKPAEVPDAKASEKVGSKFELKKTKKQGTQLSDKWVGHKFKEMTRDPFSETAKTAEILRHRGFEKKIIGFDVDYPKATYTAVTDPHRYRNLPKDVSIVDTTLSASKGKMNGMRALNKGGQVVKTAGIVAAVAEVVGQFSLDLQDGGFGETGRLLLKTGGGFAGAAVTTTAVEVGTGGAGFIIAFSAGVVGYEVGESAGDAVGDIIDLPELSEEQRSQALREGVEILGGTEALEVLEGINYAAEKVSYAVDKVDQAFITSCEFLDDNLPFNPLCHDPIELLLLRQIPIPTEEHVDEAVNLLGQVNKADIDRINSLHVSVPEPVEQISSPAVSEQEGKQLDDNEQNASYLSDADQISSAPEPKPASENSQSIHARRLAIIQARSSNEASTLEPIAAEVTSKSTTASMQDESSEKPLSFHARRLAIMQAHAENKSSANSSQAPAPTCEAPKNSDNQSVQNSSEEESTYESPRPSP